VRFPQLRENLQVVPQLPQKTWFRSFAGDFVQKRKTELNQWLQDIMKIPFVPMSKGGDPRVW
jgi:hypothetical protein